MFIFSWFPEIKLIETVFIPLDPSAFSYVLKFNVPDMLWFVSGILFLRFIWFHNYKVQKIYVLSFYGIGIAFEVSQLSASIPGTFDVLDLLFMGIGAFVEGLLYKKNVRRRFV